MSESIEDQIPKRSTRRRIVYVTLIFCYAMIALLSFIGDADNSLHQSALSWAFSLSIFVIGGYIFGAVIENGTLRNFYESRK